MDATIIISKYMQTIEPVILTREIAYGKLRQHEKVHYFIPKFRNFHVITIGEWIASCYTKSHSTTKQ